MPVAEYTKGCFLGAFMIFYDTFMIFYYSVEYMQAFASDNFSFAPLDVTENSKSNYT